jgi:hypothetical protein
MAVFAKSCENDDFFIAYLQLTKNIVLPGNAWIGLRK